MPGKTMRDFSESGKSFSICILLFVMELTKRKILPWRASKIRDFLESDIIYFSHFSESNNDFSDLGNNFSESSVSFV